MEKLELTDLMIGKRVASIVYGRLIFEDGTSAGVVDHDGPIEACSKEETDVWLKWANVQAWLDTVCVAGYALNAEETAFRKKYMEAFWSGNPDKIKSVGSLSDEIPYRETGCTA